MVATILLAMWVPLAVTEPPAEARAAPLRLAMWVTLAATEPVLTKQGGVVMALAREMAPVIQKEQAQTDKSIYFKKILTKIMLCLWQFQSQPHRATELLSSLHYQREDLRLHL